MRPTLLDSTGATCLMVQESRVVVSKKTNIKLFKCSPVEFDENDPSDGVVGRAAILDVLVHTPAGTTRPPPCIWAVLINLLMQNAFTLSIVNAFPVR